MCTSRPHGVMLDVCLNQTGEDPNARGRQRERERERERTSQGKERIFKFKIVSSVILKDFLFLSFSKKKFSKNFQLKDKLLVAQRSI